MGAGEAARARILASRSEEIAEAPNAAARKKLIAELQRANPSLWSDWCEASREAAGYSHFSRQSARYPLCGCGDVNTYALFAEHNRSLLRARARAGTSCQPGLPRTISTKKEYFSALIERRQLVALFDFQSGPGLFGDIGHARFKLLSIILGGGAERVNLVFFARSTSDIHDEDRKVTSRQRTLRS